MSKWQRWLFAIVTSVLLHWLVGTITGGLHDASLGLFLVFVGYWMSGKIWPEHADA